MANHLFLSDIVNMIINSVSLLLLYYVISANSVLTRTKTTIYKILIIATVICTVSDCLTAGCLMSGPKMYVINVILNTLGFAISPFIPALLAFSCDERMCRKWYLFLTVPAVNLIISVMSPLSGFVFRITPDNIYSRGPMFFVYILAYLYGFLLIVVSNIKLLARRADNSTAVFTSTLYVIFLVGSTCQLINPEIHTTWGCVTIVLIMYYISQREVMSSIDILTGMFNRQAYEKKLTTMEKNERGTIIIIDINNFKSINDIYGHAKGDYYIRRVASVILECFSKDGYCCRTGGDEFCIFCNTSEDTAVKKYIDNMVKKIQAERLNDEIMPTVSYGYCSYNRNDETDMEDILRHADFQMYLCKKRMKEENGEAYDSKPVIREK